jgi:hypothetical protein
MAGGQFISVRNVSIDANLYDIYAEEEEGERQDRFRSKCDSR